MQMRRAHSAPSLLTYIQRNELLYGNERVSVNEPHLSPPRDISDDYNSCKHDALMFLWYLLTLFVEAPQPGLAAQIRTQFAYVFHLVGPQDIENVLRSILLDCSKWTDPYAAENQCTRWIIQHLYHMAFNMDTNSIRDINTRMVLLQQKGCTSRIWHWVLNTAAK